MRVNFVILTKNITDKLKVNNDEVHSPTFNVVKQW